MMAGASRVAVDVRVGVGRLAGSSSPSTDQPGLSRSSNWPLPTAQKNAQMPSPTSTIPSGTIR